MGVIPADRLIVYISKAVEILGEYGQELIMCTDLKRSHEITRDTKLLALILKHMIAPYKSLLERTMNAEDINNLRKLGIM